MSKNFYHDRTNRINWYMRKTLAVRICLLMLDSRKFGCAQNMYVYGIAIWSMVIPVVVLINKNITLWCYRSFLDGSQQKSKITVINLYDYFSLKHEFQTS